MEKGNRSSTSDEQFLALSKVFKSTTSPLANRFRIERNNLDIV
jgi:hypothetical protein